jgi:hypothetical protein
MHDDAATPLVASRGWRLATVALALTATSLASPTSAGASDQIFFPAVDNVIAKLVQRINAETVRVDISAWYLTEHEISMAIANRHAAGVPVRLIGDRGSIFEIDPNTKTEFYWLANQGVPIRLRFNPTWFPEIDHWKMAIFVGQNVVEFGSANWVTFELAPWSSTNYDDETALFSDDPALVNAFKTRFDRMWNDTTPEPQSVVAAPPYLKDWRDACADEPLGCDFNTQYPHPAPMTINTARLEPDYPMPPDLIWGQGPEFNNRLVQEINIEPTFLQFVIYRLTVDNITQALLSRWQNGVQMQLIMEPQEYLNRKWPEFWLTHANIDKLWAAGIPIKQRAHEGLTHMKTLVTAAYATNASSNYAAAWQRDHDYFVSSATKPAIYTAIKNRVTTMWGDAAGFVPFQPQPPDAADLVTPVSGATGVAIDGSLVWKIAAFAVSYDVFVGTSSSSLTRVGNVAAQMDNNPPATYAWAPPTPLQPGTTYYWKIVSRTNATAVNAAIAANSTIWSFRTAGTAGPPPTPSTPSPSQNATGVSTSPTLGWAAAPLGVSYTVAFGTTVPPPQAATNLSSPSYAPGVLAAHTTYYWRVTAVSSSGSTAGPVWSFDTGDGAAGGAAGNVVIYATDIAASNLHGFTKLADASAAAGVKVSNPDAGAGALGAPLINPANYFDVAFNASGGTRYRVWLRMRAIADSKFNDSVFVQYSDSVDGTGAPIYRTGTTGGITVNLWTCATCGSTGWGWQRNAYWLEDAGDVWFQNSGSHTLRVQVREDGIEIDQIVLSPTTYATNPPGPVSNDTTIVPQATQGPGVPATPSPANGATGAATNPVLSWSSTGATSYDVLFGTTNPPPLVVSGAAGASYTPPALTDSTTYYWQIVARNGTGSTTGAVWSFTTFMPAPGTPAAPNPSSGATAVPTNVTLTWSSTAATSFDVLLGPNDPPAQVATGIAAASYTPTSLAPGTTYVWQIVAHNAGGTNQGPQWTFTTAAASQPPSAPGSPSPAAGASGVSSGPTLTWSAPGAASFDVRFGTVNPPPPAAQNLATAAYAPGALASSTTYYWQATARNGAGTTPGPVWSFVTAPATVSNEIVIYAADLPPSAFHGAWTTAADATAAAGLTLATPDAGVANTGGALAAPADYVEAAFSAPAGTYRFWMRMRAPNNSKFNDSVYVQFSDATASGAPVYAMNSANALVINLATDGTATSLNAWGWVNGAYWLTQETAVTFTSGGSHTLRIQTREDGALIDQLVLSPTTYFAVAPGPAAADHTIVAKPSQPQAPATPSSQSPGAGAGGVATNASLAWGALGATSYDVYFGATNPPSPVSASQAAASYSPGPLSGSTTYFWQVVAHNSAGATTGPIWSFTTAVPGPPGAPLPSSPADGALNVPPNATLTWSAAGATSYDVSFGATNPPPAVSSNQVAASFAPGALAFSTTYFWRVSARNAAGTAVGPVWSFGTGAAPPPPGPPSTPAPPDAAQGVPLAVVLNWTAAEATSYDVRFGTSTPPPTVAGAQTEHSFTPASLTYGTTYFWQIISRNAGGTTAGPVWSFTTATAPIDQVVVYPTDIPASAIHGAWSFATDPTSPNSTKLITTDSGYSSVDAPLAAPIHYVDVPFTAESNKPYRIWLRLKALNNSKLNDAVWVQFSDAIASGTPVYAINSTDGLAVNLATDSSAASLSGWGWQNGAYWLAQSTTLTFASSGTHTLRIQVREDGVQLDQIVLSAATYLSTAPGPVSNDSTIVPKP